MKPTKPLVLKAMREFQAIGTTEFLKKYTNGYAPRYMYLRYENVLYPLKALWTASHQPAIAVSTFTSVQAQNGFSKLGFDDAVDIEEEGKLVSLVRSGAPKLKGESIFADDVRKEAVFEGERHRKEVAFIKRNSAIVAKAKRELGCDCWVCGFNFGDVYGGHGYGFIEAHHIEPLSTRSESKETSVTDFAMLCANCHRMIHRSGKPMSVDELKRVVKRNQKRITRAD